MFKYVILSACLFIICISKVYSNPDYDGMVHIKLEHGLDGTEAPTFIERGNISIPSLRIGTAMVHQKITNEDRLKIKELALNNQFYQMRATVVTNDGANHFVSFVKACMLAESELSDIITITLDYTGKIVTIIDSIASTSTCEGSDVPLHKLKDFSTSVFVRHTYGGPGPDTNSYVQKLEREREAKEKGDVKDNKSFLAKYWMYIVPVVLIMVLSTAANPDGAAGGAR